MEKAFVMSTAGALAADALRATPTESAIIRPASAGGALGPGDSGSGLGTNVGEETRRGQYFQKSQISRSRSKLGAPMISTMCSNRIEMSRLVMEPTQSARPIASQRLFRTARCH